MLLSYLIALIPVVVGASLYIWRKEIVWWEWAISTVAGFLTALIFNCIAVAGMTTDFETWSGQVTVTIRHPEWVEEYQVAIYKTVHKTRTSEGKTESYTEEEFDHYETRYRKHHEYFDIKDTLSQTLEITRERYDQICQTFGGFEKEDGHNSGFYSGDPLIYPSRNKTGFIHPTTATRMWENKVKASPSVFSYVKVDDPNVFEYPQNTSPWRSNRLLGSAATIPIAEFDKINSKLGPTKKVNIIMVGFPDDADSSMAQLQEAKWIGGKKNDLVLCYGGSPRWTYVFGWTEEELVKKNLQTILLTHPIDDNILPLIEEEVGKNYKLKDWSKFDYLSVEPPAWSYSILIIVMVLTQAGFWVFAFVNIERKDAPSEQK